MTDRCSKCNTRPHAPSHRYCRICKNEALRAYRHAMPDWRKEQIRAERRKPQYDGVANAS